AFLAAGCFTAAFFAGAFLAAFLAVAFFPPFFTGIFAAFFTAFFFAIRFSSSDLLIPARVTLSYNVRAILQQGMRYISYGRHRTRGRASSPAPQQMQRGQA